MTTSEPSIEFRDCIWLEVILLTLGEHTQADDLNSQRNDSAGITEIGLEQAEPYPFSLLGSDLKLFQDLRWGIQP